MAGQSVRLIEIEAEVSPNNVFERIPSQFKDSADFADYLDKTKFVHYGHLGRAFIQRFTEMYGQDKARSEYHIFEKHFINRAKREIRHKDAGGQLIRVAKSFAVVGWGGELATIYGLTGWPTGEAIEACVKCLKVWYRSVLGSNKSSQDRQILNEIALHLNGHKNHFLNIADRDITPPLNPDKHGYFKVFKKEKVLLFSDDYLLYQVFGGNVSDYQRGVRSLKKSSFLLRQDSENGKGLKLTHRNPLYRPNGIAKSATRFYTIRLRELERYVGELVA